MAQPDMSGRPHTPQFSTLNSYNTDYEYFHSYSSSYPSSVPQYQEHGSSPVSTNRTSSNHAYMDSGSYGGRSERFSDKSRARLINSNDSEVNYAEVTYPEPQFLPHVQTGTDDKEAYRNPTPIMNERIDDEKYTISRVRGEQRRRRKCGLKPIVFWAIVAFILLIILGIALGIGLGLGLGHKNKISAEEADEIQKSQTLIGGAINSKYYSKHGAFNGSGIAIASANQGTQSDIFVFYQKYTGELIQEYFSADGSWHTVSTMPVSAKNATPISAVAYVYNNVAITHLFYLDPNNYVRESITSNVSSFQSNIWYDGPLNSLNLKSYNAELVGMQACYWGNYYGSSSNFNQTSYPTKSVPTTGINLLYARDNSTFDQYDWTNGQNGWNFTRSFTGMNTRAGIGCQSWLTNTTQYFMMVDNTNTMRIIWRDTDVNKTSTTAHPINQWTNTAVSIPNMHPSTSLGFTDYLAYQDADSSIRGVNINWAAENTSIATVPGSPNTQDTWTVDTSHRGIPGTHFAITGLATQSGGRQLALFYQSVSDIDGGDGVTIGFRDSSYRGTWSYIAVPFNQTN